ncbi:MAG: hypothetical protein L6455_01175, partial [Kiritimatiellae bacterium]|nr:hypothetical protein [Kiritimatiellia bacterium]
MMKKMMIPGLVALVMGVFMAAPDVHGEVSESESMEACGFQGASPSPSQAPLSPPVPKRCESVSVAGAKTGGFVPFLRQTFNISHDTHIDINGLSPFTLNYKNRYVNVSALGKSWTSIADTRIFSDLPACVNYKYVILRHANGNNYLY